MLRLNERAVDLSAWTSSETALRQGPGLTLSAEERALLTQWSRIGDATATLGDVARHRLVHAAWSCSTCLVFGGGMTLTDAACAVSAISAVDSGGMGAATALATCGAALSATALFYQNCGGACA